MSDLCWWFFHFSSSAIRSGLGPNTFEMNGIPIRHSCTLLYIWLVQISKHEYANIHDYDGEHTSHRCCNSMAVSSELLKIDLPFYNIKESASLLLCSFSLPTPLVRSHMVSVTTLYVTSLSACCGLCLFCPWLCEQLSLVRSPRLATEKETHRAQTWRRSVCWRANLLWQPVTQELCDPAIQQTSGDHLPRANCCIYSPPTSTRHAAPTSERKLGKESSEWRRGKKGGRKKSFERQDKDKRRAELNINSPNNVRNNSLDK